MNLKQIAQKLGGYIQSKTQDDEGFIRQGNFTTQPIQQAVQNWQQKPSNQLVNRVVQSQPVQNFASGLKQSPVYNFGQTIGKTISSPFVFKTLQQNTQQYQQNINTALKMANQAKTQEDKQKWLNLAKSSQSLLEKQTGNVQQEYNKTPLQITGEGLGTAATLIGGPKLTPKTALTMAGISGGLSKVSGGSFAQGAGTGLAYAPVYAGISQLTNPLLSKVVGLTPVKAKVGERIVSGLSNVGQGIVSDISTGQKTTPLSMGIDLATGIVGGKEQFDTGVKVKGMTDQVFTQDKNIVNEARQILKFNTDTPDQLDKLRDTMKVLAKKYELTSQPNWNKFTLEKQYEILSNQMDEMAKNWANVSMGITDQPIKTGDNLINEARKYKSADEFVKALPTLSKIERQAVEGSASMKAYINDTTPLGKGVEIHEAIERPIYFDTPRGGGGKLPAGHKEALDTEIGFYKSLVPELNKYKNSEIDNVIIKRLQEKYGKGIYGNELSSPIPFNAKNATESEIYNLVKNKLEKIDTKSQLTEIWNKANKNNADDALINEAKKYKSAEEFINTQEPTIKIKPNEDLVKTFDETIKIKPSEKVKVSGMAIEQPELKQRGFSVSVQEAPNVSKKVKTQVLGGYEVKPNDVLMGEAKALLSEGVDLKNINKIENIDQKIAATIQEAINLDAAGKHKEAAALFNNLSELGTQVGRGTQAFSLLNKMSPEAISLSVAGKIKKYNLTHNKKLPELTGEQQKQLSKQVNEALKFPVGSKERGIALGKVNETINSFIPSTFADKFITVWKAGLLSSLRTHERNIVGNVIMQGSEQASLYPAAGADWLMSLATGKRSLVASQKGTVKGALEGGQTAADVIKYGFDPSGTEIGKYETKKVTWGNNPVEQALKKATDVVFNTLEAEDKVFWKSSYNRSLYNQAATEALNQGKKGDAKFIQQLFDNATEQMKQTAFNDANYATFKDKNMLSGAIGQLKSWVNRQTGPAAEAGKIVSEMLMPFTGVPTSIVGKTVAYSPIGLVKGSVDFGRVVAGSEVPGLQRQAAQEIGRGVIGSGIFGLGAYLMSQGLMTGQAKDQKERDQWALEGKQENSVLVNGKWRNIGSVGPQTLVLLAGAKANETANDPEQNLGSYAFGTLNDQLNQTFLSGVQQPLSALNEPYKAKSYLGGQVSSLIPNIVKDTSKAFDPLAREVDTSTIGSSIKGRVQQSIPFVRNKMIPQRDVLGNEIAQTPTGIGAYFDLFNSTTPISNNVVDELSRLNQAGYNKTPTRLDKNQTIGGEKMTLNQAQLDRLEIVTGLATDKALNDLFNTTAYQSLDDAEKQDAIGDVITKTRKNVRAKINLKNIEEKSYTTSSDSQLAELGGFGMFTKSVTTNPKSAINALLTGNPIRKISDGNIVVLERQNDIGSYDLGDTTSQVDHIIPLSLGGTNEVRNLQILTNEEHAIKTKTDMYLLNQVQSGQMSLKDAQEKAKNWRDTALSLPKNAQSQIIDEIDSESPEKQSDGSKVYKLVSDAGNVTLVDLGTPIQQPEYTGFDAIDKKLKSSYKSAITKRINNIVKLYEDGQLSATEANKLISELKTQSGTGTKKTKKAKKITFKVTSPKALPKITLKISSPVSRVKLKSAPKVKLSTSSNRKYTIKA
jgi:hypothetical protein